MKPLIVSAICFAIALVYAVLLFNSCAARPILDGQEVKAPWGYQDFCRNNPESELYEWISSMKLSEPGVWRKFGLK